VKVGDRVTLVAIPADLHDDDELRTRTLFEKCLGKTFTIAALQTVDGLPYQLVQLDVGRVVGKASYLESIWVEPVYLQVKDPE
jgi:hypothetical protein